MGLWGTHCNTNLPSGATHCPVCGVSLADGVAPTAEARIGGRANTADTTADYPAPVTPVTPILAVAAPATSAAFAGTSGGADHQTFDEPRSLRQRRHSRGAWAVAVACLVLIPGGAFVLGSRGTSGSKSAGGVRDQTQSSAGSSIYPQSTGRLTRPAPTASAHSPDAGASVALLQQWIDALASGNWSMARRLQPAIGQTDGQLQSGYGGLRAATIVYRSGTANAIQVVSVAQEDVSSGRRTSVYCIAASADLAARTIRIRTVIRIAAPVGGWVGLDGVADQIALCP